MKKKKISNLTLKKTTVSHLSGGICKCRIRVPQNGIADGSLGTLCLCFTEDCTGGCNSNTSAANEE